MVMARKYHILSRIRFVVFVLLGILIGTSLLRVKLYFSFKSLGVCKGPKFDLSKPHAKKYDPHKISEQIVDETKWFYKNGIDGLWRQWEMTVNNQISE